jgi:hypothetical protein
MRQLKEELKQEHPELAAALDKLDVKHVAMINTNLFGVRDTHVDQSDISSKAKGDQVRGSREDFDKTVEALVKQTERGDIVGVDIAGAEHYAFDAEGQARFEHLYAALQEAALKRGEPIVLRPHVGEGANDMVPGKHFQRDSDRQVRNDRLWSLSGAVRAEDNLDRLIKSLQKFAGPDGKLPPEVIVRFGHATHATPEQAREMAKLGIIAEVNLQSNVETGASAQRGPADAQHDYQSDGSANPLHDGSVHHDGNLEDHALTTLILNDVPIVLSTDGASVMSTNMANEYARAKQIIDDVLAGNTGIGMSEGQAAELGVPGAKPRSTRKMDVFLSQIPAEKRGPIEDKFRGAYDKLYQDANDYYDHRPHQGGN